MKHLITIATLSVMSFSASSMILNNGALLKDGSTDPFERVVVQTMLITSSLPTIIVDDVEVQPVSKVGAALLMQEALLGTDKTPIANSYAKHFNVQPAIILDTVFGLVEQGEEVTVQNIENSL